MRWVLKTKHYASIGLGAILLILDFVLLFDFSAMVPGQWYFNPIVVIAILIGGMPFLFDFLNENKRQKDIGEKFLEFVRALVENVHSGVSIPKAILHASRTDYGSLTPYVKKLAHQLEWGFPLHDALKTFAYDTDNEVIARSVNIVIQAEKSGGDMAAVLEAVTSSVYEIKKVKEEQKSQAYGQTIQGYIIFFIFVIVMIVLEVYLVPQLSSIASDLSGTVTGLPGAMPATPGGAGDLDLGIIFNLTIAIQGLFAGLMVGKFSDGLYKAGIKHSIIMVVLGYLMMSAAAGIVGV